MLIATNWWIIKLSAACRSSASVVSTSQRHEQNIWIRKGDMTCTPAFLRAVLRLLGTHRVLRLNITHFSTGQQQIFSYSSPSLYSCFTTVRPKRLYDFLNDACHRGLNAAPEPPSVSISIESEHQGLLFCYEDVYLQTDFIGRTRRHPAWIRLSLSALPDQHNLDKHRLDTSRWTQNRA